MILHMASLSLDAFARYYADAVSFFHIICLFLFAFTILCLRRRHLLLYDAFAIRRYFDAARRLYFEKVSPPRFRQML